MSDRLCPFLRAQAVAAAVTIAAQIDGVERAPKVQSSLQAVGALALIPDPAPELLRRVLDSGWMMEAQRCTVERCAWWDHETQECSQINRGG